MRAGRLRWIGVALCLAAGPVHALQLDLPRNARQTAARDSALDQVSIPVGPFNGTTVRTRQIEGNVTRRAYKLDAPGVTPLQILAPLRQQIERAGFEVVLDCNQITCGGYDFRFAIEVLPAPNMYVNIRAFHVLTGLDRQSGEAITLLASSGDDTAYLQIIRVRLRAGAAPITAVPPAVEGPTQVAEKPPAEDIATRLLGEGSVVLHDMDFAVGTTALDDRPSDDLAALAALMVARPALRLAVVGHTDTGGGLEANIAVSRARAQSVRTRLIEVYGADPGRVAAEGMGYLAPRASNLTPEGREANRRVEVIVIAEEE